jgi:hypothetical protein
MSWRDDQAYEEAQLKAFLEWREYWSWQWERWRYFLAGASTVWAGILLWQLLA